MPGTEKPESTKLADEEGGDFDDDDMNEGEAAAYGASFNESGTRESVTLDASQFVGDMNEAGEAKMTSNDKTIDLKDLREDVQQDAQAPAKDSDVTVEEDETAHKKVEL